jgi:anti-anti-sigma factor
MKTPATNLSVWVRDKLVWIKVAGRANFTSSVDFKTLVNKLWEKGHTAFVLDLSDCLLMDSTFLGVLAGLGLKFSHAQNGNHAACIELLNPNPRISDLLENLGVAHLFTVRQGLASAPQPLASMEEVASSPERKDVTRTCLEAHQTLMEINPANVPKFKDVAKFLAEDLKKMEEGSADK